MRINDMQIDFIRHGATAGNLERRYVGTTDEPLTEETIQKLTEIRECYPRPQLVFVSPLLRCVQTAKLLFPEAQPQAMDGLRECGFGEFEYKNYEDLNGDPRYQAWIDSGGTAAFPGGECRADFCERCCAAFETACSLAEEKGAEHIAFVVHGGTIMAILDHYSDPHRGYFDWQVKNAEGFTARLRFEGQENSEAEDFAVRRHELPENLAASGNGLSEDSAASGNGLSEDSAACGNGLSEDSAASGNGLSEDFVVRGNGFPEDSAACGNDFPDNHMVSWKTEHHRNSKRRILTAIRPLPAAPALTGVEDQFVIKKNKKLRCGYTTGSCAAAAAKAAAEMLLTGRMVSRSDLLTPKGMRLHLPVEEQKIGPDFASCAVRKYAGDDPDATNGTLIFARAEYLSNAGLPEGSDCSAVFSEKGMQNPGSNGNAEPEKMGADTFADGKQSCTEASGIAGALFRTDTTSGIAGKLSRTDTFGTAGKLSRTDTSGTAEMHSAQEASRMEKDGGFWCPEPFRENGQRRLCWTDSAGRIYLSGGEGVGLVTKPGLEQPVGAPAINRVPRDMILKEVTAVCEMQEYGGCLRITVSVPEGAEIARKTFNPHIGILGGISILGTSGIVAPMSEEALIASIRLEMRQKVANGEQYILITPGNYGEDFIRRKEISARLDAENSMKCSNYVGETLDMAAELGVKGILFVAHIGKFVKVSGGVMNTHSAHADCRAELMAAQALRAGAPGDLALRLLDTNTTEEAVDILKEAGFLTQTMEEMTRRIHFHLQKHCLGALKTEVILYSSQYGYLGETEGAEELPEKIILQQEAE